MKDPSDSIGPLDNLPPVSLTQWNAWHRLRVTESRATEGKIKVEIKSNKLIYCPSTFYLPFKWKGIIILKSIIYNFCERLGIKVPGLSVTRSFWGLICVTLSAVPEALLLSGTSWSIVRVLEGNSTESLLHPSFSRFCFRSQRDTLDPPLPNSWNNTHGFCSALEQQRC